MGGNFSSPIRGELGWSSSDFALFHEQEQEHLKLRYRRHNLAWKEFKKVSVLKCGKTCLLFWKTQPERKKMGEYLFVETFTTYQRGKIEMKLSRKRQENVGYKILAVEIQKEMQGNHTSQTLPKLCKDSMIPFVVFGWILYGLWLVFHVFLVVFLFFHGSSHDFWLVFIVLHSSRMVFHGCWLVFMFSHGFRLAFQVFYWDLFMKDQLLVQKLHMWPNSYREVRWPLKTLRKNQTIKVWVCHKKWSLPRIASKPDFRFFASNYIRKWEHNTRVCSSYCQ